MMKFRLLITFALCACSSKSEPIASKPIPKVERQEAAVVLPTSPAVAGGLTWSHQPPLVRRATKSKIRAAEYELESDPQAELAVMYFGKGRAETVEAQVARWLVQFAQPDGSDSGAKTKRSERKVGELPIKLIETTGTFAGSALGASAPVPIADAMLLGAVAEGPNGAVYFKLVGKRASVSAARASFDALLDSIRPAS